MTSGTPRQGTKGHRFIRTLGKPRAKVWALWEHDGTRYKRIGTARDQRTATLHIFYGDEAETDLHLSILNKENAS